jgi:hypothetical protein
MPESSSRVPSSTREDKCVTLVPLEERSHTPMGSTISFVYLKGQMRDLHDLLSAAPSGWTITAANGINDRGQIVANALSSDGTILHAVLLSPRY